jgi:hypothetical protein
VLREHVPHQPVFASLSNQSLSDVEIGSLFASFAFRAFRRVPTDAVSLARPFLRMSSGFGRHGSIFLGNKIIFYTILSYSTGAQVHLNN